MAYAHVAAQGPDHPCPHRPPLTIASQVPPEAPAALVGYLVERVETGAVSRERIDESVRRVLRMKLG